MLLLVYIYAEKNVLLISSGYWIDWKNFFFYIVYLSWLSLVSPSQRSLTHQNKITNICIVNNRQQKSKKQIVAIVIILSCRCWHCSCYSNRNLDVISQQPHPVKGNLSQILQPESIRFYLTNANVGYNA